MSGVGDAEAHIRESSCRHLPAGLREHFRLDVQQLNMTQRNSLCELYTIEPRTRAHLEDPIPGADWESVYQGSRRKKQSPQWIVEQPRKPMRKRSAQAVDAPSG